MLFLLEGDIALNILEPAFANITLGQIQSHKNLAMFPLLGSNLSTVDYITLDDAIGSGAVTVSEISPSGSVSEINFKNHGTFPVFILDGEELIGAKQNRILNLSVLAPPVQTIILPVSCVEQGRWDSQSTNFSSSNRAHYSKGRAAKANMVSYSLSAGDIARTDQQEIWRGIDAKSDAFSVRSESGAMSDIYDSESSAIDQFVKTFSPLPEQIGCVFILNGIVAGFDLFESSRTLAKLLPKLVRSYALDALETNGPAKLEDNQEAADSFKNSIAEAKMNEFSGVGLGTDYRLANENLSGGALIYEDRLIHASAFPSAENSGSERAERTGRIVRSIRRRNLH
jgi:hypothetical protein